MIDNIKTIFEKAESSDSFTRIDNKHKINIHIGKDSSFKHTMFIVSEQKPMSLKSSELIDVYIGKRIDNHWGLSFTLKDNKWIDMFCHFCDDIVESSRNVKSERQGIDFICERYLSWQKMLKKENSNLLSKNEIKGIIGELIFLKNFLIKNFDQRIAINSWLGPEGLPKDFICVNRWYEIKSVTSASEKVVISSIEQLDDINDGELVIITLDDTSETDIDSININNYFNTLLQRVENYDDKFKIISKLNELGFYERDEYNSYSFKLKKVKRYVVNRDFPCLRRLNMPRAILLAKYELSLGNLEDFLIEESNEWK